MLASLLLLAFVLANDEDEIPTKMSWKPWRYGYHQYLCSEALGGNAAIDSCPPVTDYEANTACTCSMEGFSLSVLNCVINITRSHGLPETAITDSWWEYQDLCKTYGAKMPFKFEEGYKKLQAEPVTTTYHEANETRSMPYLPDPDLMPEDLIQDYIRYHKQYHYAVLFGMISIWYPMGILLIQAILHWSAYVLPGALQVFCNNTLSRYLRRYIVLPAMFRRSRSQPVKALKFFLLSFPPRLHAMFFVGYLIISIIGLALYYPYTPTLNYPTHRQYIGQWLGWRSGMIAIYKMVLVYLFAGRNNILIWLTGWQYEIFNHWHRWIGRLFTIDVIIHSIAYSLLVSDPQYGEPYTEVFKQGYWSWGVAATVLVSFLTFNGTKTLRQMCYEVFLYVHIVLAIAALFSTWYHVRQFSGHELVWPCVAFWGFDRLVRLVKVVVSNPMAKARVIAHPDGKVLQVEITYSGIWKPRAGTYVFVHFLFSPLYALQSHPFTIVDKCVSGQFSLFCRVHNGLTKKLFTRALENGGTLQCRVLIEGPYGVDFATKTFKEIVLFAGGIGITAVYSHLKHISDASSYKGQTIYVHWAIANKDPLKWFKQEFEFMASLPNVQMIVHVAAGISSIDSTSDILKSSKSNDVEDVSSGQSNITYNSVEFAPNFDGIVGDHIQNSQGAIVFFVCGPPPMTDAIRYAVAHRCTDTKHFVEYFEESFSM